MKVEKTLLDDFLLSVLSYHLLVHSFFFRVLDDVLHPHCFFPVVVGILDVFVEKMPDDMLSSLEAVMFD